MPVLFPDSVKRVGMAGNAIGARITVHGKDLSDHDVESTATTTRTLTTASDGDADGISEAPDNCPPIFDSSRFDNDPAGIGDRSDSDCVIPPGCSP